MCTLSLAGDALAVGACCACCARQAGLAVLGHALGGFAALRGEPVCVVLSRAAWS
jgi:hypothetical protein